MTVNRTDNDITGWPKTKEKKRQERQRAASSLSHRGEPDNARHFSNAVQMPGKCAHAKKATEYTIDCFVFFLPELFFFFWVIPRCAERQSTGGKNSFVCVCPLLLRARGGRVKTFQRIRFHSPITK
jgi:hypothetical protein